MKQARCILGIDPGFDRCGFGVIEQNGVVSTWVAHGCLQTSSKDDFSLRLQQLRDAVATMIEKYKPAAVAVEKLFFQTNVKTAMTVGMARGVILLAIADAGVPLIELTPNQVKQGITGSGRADKIQVEKMVLKTLKLRVAPTPDDATDALAIAVVGGLLFH